MIDTHPGWSPTARRAGAALRTQEGVSSLFWCVWLAVAAIICLVLFSVLFPMRSKRRAGHCLLRPGPGICRAVVPEFQKETGIKVSAVYDSEAVKTVGLANRLLAERSHPQCDVFWGNEEMRTRQIAAQNVFRETNGWAAFGYRSRRMVINTNRISLASAPRSLLELTNEIWRGKVALAYPQFGTTATHFHALRQHWGDGVASMVPGAGGQQALPRGRQFGRGKDGWPGEAWIGLTDSDDIADGQREGLPIEPCR